MQTLLKDLRKTYFDKIVTYIPPFQNLQFVVLTHILEDRPEILNAVKLIGNISLVIAIPYSINTEVLTKIAREFPIVTPNLDQLYDKKFLKQSILNYLKPKKPTIILEIGGYIAPVLKELHEEFDGQILGVVEDTESGHIRYEKIIESLPCPVISVARSLLKETEDHLVGASCLYSTEKLLRQSGCLIEGKPSLILGFGKVGEGLAYALEGRNCPVSVYDINPIRRLKALSKGFQIPDKDYALASAEVIYGATGNYSIKGEEFNSIQNGALLVSCSSKNVEFDLSFLHQHYCKQNIFSNLDSYRRANQTLYLAAKGQPINFIDGAVMGPLLTLVQSEIIIAIKQLIELQGSKGLFETSYELKKMLAERWFECFCNKETGYYKMSDLDAKFIHSKHTENVLNI